MITATTDALKKANDQFPGAPWFVIGDVARNIQIKQLVKDWIADTYNIDSTKQKVSSLLKKMEEKHGIKIYYISGRDTERRVIPITSMPIV